jgi:endogenous inhibitor of DNA gyrase (YacG/DUF329 family)/very-short-patch-repair endonuclease
MLPKNTPLSARGWHIIHDLYEIPKCKKCKNKTKWVGSKGGYYQNYCSKGCSIADKSSYATNGRTSIEKIQPFNYKSIKDIKHFISKDQYYNKNIYLNKNIEYASSIKFHTSFLDNNTSLSQRLWHIINDKMYIIKCPICDNEVNWQNKNIKYSEYCSLKCVHSDVKVIKKIKKENNRKYNHDYYRQSLISSSSRLKLENNKWMKCQHNDLKKSINTIAHELSVDGTTVSAYMKKHGIEINLYSKSFIETFLSKFLNDNDIDHIINDRNMLDGKELDIYIPSHNLAIELNGLYWHNELFKDKNYHSDKTELGKNHGIRILHFFEDEILKNQISLNTKYSIYSI